MRTIVGALLFSTLCSLGCRASERYLVTAAPLDVGGGTRLCVAVDPHDAHGVWWWEAGPSGCSTRSTGPGVFPAWDGTVINQTNPASVAVRFRLQEIGPSDLPPFDVQLVIERDVIRSMASGAAVPLIWRKDLDLPSTLPGGR